MTWNLAMGQRDAHVTVVVDLSAVAEVYHFEGSYLQLGFGSLLPGGSSRQVRICDFRPLSLEAAAAFDSAVLLNQDTAILRNNLQNAVNRSAYAVVTRGPANAPGSVNVNLFNSDQPPVGALVARLGEKDLTHLNRPGRWSHVSRVTDPALGHLNDRILVVVMTTMYEPADVTIPEDDLARLAGLRTPHAQYLGYYETSP